LGHAQTFWTAQERTGSKGGILVFRNEDLDHGRCKPQFVEAMFEDLRWFGLNWQEGPDCGGPFAPYSQSERREHYVTAFERLRAAGALFHCTCSRQDVLRALQAPHLGEDEPLYPGTCRHRISRPENEAFKSKLSPARQASPAASKATWRFRVPDGDTIEFTDGHYGPQRFVAGKDFGDFVVWRQDDLPSYQLAVVVDDAAMRITEVVRGQDLLKSTARQLLLYRALGWTPPKFFHCPLVTDESGIRLAKRHDALSLRALRDKGFRPEELRQGPLKR
jgi:glutamyl-tRNA synthetase